MDDLEAITKGLEGLADYLNDNGKASLAATIAQLRAHRCWPQSLSPVKVGTTTLTPIEEVEEEVGPAEESEVIDPLPKPKVKRAYNRKNKKK